MRSLRFFSFIPIILLSSPILFGATSLVSLVDARPSGGTATGTFVNNALPSFLLAPVSNTFGIRNNAAHPAGPWQFAIGANGMANISTSPTINLNQIISFSSSPVAIDASAIGFSADRFSATETGYLFAKLGNEYHAFLVAKWSNNNNADPDGDRVRFYLATPATISSAPITAVPEPSIAMSLCLGALALGLRRKRQH